MHSCSLHLGIKFIFLFPLVCKTYSLMLLRCQMQYNMLMLCPHYAGVDSVNGSQSLFSWPLVTEIMACAAVRGTTSGFHCYHGPRVVMWVQMTPLTRWAPLGHVRISEKSTRKQPTLPHPLRPTSETLKDKLDQKILSVGVAVILHSDIWL